MRELHGAKSGLMRQAAKLAVLSLGVALWLSSSAFGASFDCDARGLSRTEVAICADPLLSRTDEQVARKADTIARRMNYGQYLGLRFWQNEAARQRDQCGPDRTCINAHYRAQRRLLDRVQECLDTRFTRRACLRDSLAGDQAVLRR